MMDQSDKDWWRHGVFYQIYPRSFQDSDGDGVGERNASHMLEALRARESGNCSVSVGATLRTHIVPFTTLCESRVLVRLDGKSQQ